MKNKESLEEVCDKVLNYLYPNCKIEMNALQYGNSINALKSISRWKSEKMYSEEEVRNIANWAFGFYRRNDLSDSELEEEFNRILEEQFKNK